MDYPKISIITPSYNQGQYLEDTILSVLGQNYPNLEYMIFDGDSSDNTVEVIKKYSDKIVFWVSEPDQGQSDAINKGFSKATGDILMWLNSDDMLMPNVLHYIAEQYRKNGDGIYFGNCIHFGEQKEGLYSYGSNVVESFNKFPLELLDTIIQPSSFWSKQVWKTNGALKDNLHFGFDWEWFLRAKENNVNFFPLNKPISIYRIHDAHKTGVGGKKRQEELLKIYKMYNSKYTELFELIMNENLTLTVFEKNLKKINRVLLRKNVSDTHFIRKRNKKYKKYSLKEIDKIKTML